MGTEPSLSTHVLGNIPKSKKAFLRPLKNQKVSALAAHAKARAKRAK
jgi:hypothetical protein